MSAEIAGARAERAIARAQKLQVISVFHSTPSDLRSLSYVLVSTDIHNSRDAPADDHNNILYI